MYGGTCSIILLEYTKCHNDIKLGHIIWVWLIPVAMGGLIEILQAYCTNGRRSGDWIDFIANIIGATIAFFIGLLIIRVRKNTK